MDRSPPGVVGLSGASSAEVHRPLTCAVCLQVSLDLHTGEPQTTLDLLHFPQDSCIHLNVGWGLPWAASTPMTAVPVIGMAKSWHANQNTLKFY